MSDIFSILALGFAGYTYFMSQQAQQTAISMPGAISSGSTIPKSMGVPATTKPQVIVNLPKNPFPVKTNPTAETTTKKTTSKPTSDIQRVKNTSDRNIKVTKKESVSTNITHSANVGYGGFSTNKNPAQLILTSNVPASVNNGIITPKGSNVGFDIYGNPYSVVQDNSQATTKKEKITNYGMSENPNSFFNIFGGF